MTSVATALPLLGLRITAGPVELRGMPDDLLGPLADLAIKGVHDRDFMPFYRKCGYTENGVMVRKRMDKPATLQLLLLELGNLVRYEHELTVEGLPEFRRSIGLDA